MLKFKWEMHVLANMTRVSDVAPGPLVIRMVINCKRILYTSTKNKYRSIEIHHESTQS
jgi:hypothetical protein